MDDTVPTRPAPRRHRTLAGVLTAAALTAVVGAAGARAHDGPEDLRTAEQATARYQRVEAALHDGYLPTGECVSSSQGAMGEHYVNPVRLLDGVLDPARPEGLLYVPSPRGPRLVGIEYVKLDGDQRTDTDADRPTLFGRPFDGPMPGHRPGDPVHYDLHVWLFSENPSGLFAPYNPNESCG